jgi:ubiquinone/menaquinone biosynthesis C-methylase UbiE
MERIPEPEIMGDEEQALAYARADFSGSNQWFVDHLLAEYPDKLGEVLDLGCGPGDVMRRLASASPTARITAVDGSPAMIALARSMALENGLTERITPLQGILPGLPLPEGGFDAILSKDLLHHLPDPMVLWSEARRLGRPDAAIYVMDLMRPRSPKAARRIVEKVAPNEPAVLKEDFFASLCAAFTPEEARDQVQRAGLSLEVAEVTGRHMVIKGVLGGAS